MRVLWLSGTASHILVNAGCFAGYTVAIGLNQPIAVALTVSLALALILHVLLLFRQKSQALASVERRAALIRAAQGHPECERLVLAALRAPLTNAGVVRVFEAVCKTHDDSGRSLVTRNAETIVADFESNCGQIEGR